MGNSNRVALDELGDAIAKQLEMYSKDVQQRVSKAGAKAIKDLARKTKDAAPFDARAHHRHYRDLIATKAEKARTGDDVYVWYVKPPGHRLTHLLVKGHATRDGGRTRADPFLAHALASVLPEYEKEVEEAVKP